MPMLEEHSELVWLSPLSVFVFVSIIIILVLYWWVHPRLITIVIIFSCINNDISHRPSRIISNFMETLLQITMNLIVIIHVWVMYISRESIRNIQEFPLL